jgi:hypothetical protein
MDLRRSKNYAGIAKQDQDALSHRHVWSHTHIGQGLNLDTGSLVEVVSNTKATKKLHY